MGEMSPWHWAIVILIAVLLFGARRLPDAARSLGRSARILKAELSADTAPATPEPGPAPAASPLEPPAPVARPVTDSADVPAAKTT